MSHCWGCHKVIQVADSDLGISPEEIRHPDPDCPGCGHEAQLAAQAQGILKLTDALSKTLDALHYESTNGYGIWQEKGARTRKVFQHSIEILEEIRQRGTR